jgi:predicted N-acetyltransferase YhbS
MQIKVRPETIEDASTIDKVILLAYESISYSDHTEHIMVHRLRESEAYLPQLSLVAEIADQIVGHIMLTSVVIKGKGKSFPSLALAPLSVLPAFQKRGVGTALVNQAHARARHLGFSSIIVVGIPGYYPKFGYSPLSTYDIKVPFKIREENCFIISLTPDALSGVSGLVEYPREWTQR